MKFGVGQSVRRQEDDPLLRGGGRYVADHRPAGCLEAVMVRSPHPHARFRIDAATARTLPGVRLVLTGADTSTLGPLPVQAGIDGVDIWVPAHAVLAIDEVRHVGDAVAFVIADTLEQARDAAEAIALEWQPEPHVIGAVEALQSNAAKVWRERPDNLAFAVAIGDQGATERGFAAA